MNLIGFREPPTGGPAELEYGPLEHGPHRRPLNSAGKSGYRGQIDVSLATSSDCHVPRADAARAVPVQGRCLAD